MHLAHINHPVVADPVYGRKSDAPKFGEKQLLHSYKISFVHPVTGALLELESELPDYFKKAIELLKLYSHAFYFSSTQAVFCPSFSTSIF